ncbi:MAG TPA: thioredoxin-like domain-containing protein [Polyangia bacterium]|nr:thioredoxin-like domain-containing protein [Polyangia bacterium]
MDRLPALGALALLAFGLAAHACGVEDGSVAPSRVERVAAVPAGGGSLDPADWCGVHHPEGAGPQLTWPAVVDGATGRPAPAPAVSGERWLWINLWATWCGPCLREMPIIRSWVDALRRDGARVELIYLSVDEDAGALGRALASGRDGSPRASLRLASPDGLAGWLGRLGLPEGSAIPINILVGPKGDVRCVRIGSIADGDFPIVERVLGQVRR